MFYMFFFCNFRLKNVVPKVTTQTTTPMANRKNGVSTKEKCQDCTVSTITYNFPIKSKYRTFIIGHLQQNNTLNGKR